MLKMTIAANFKLLSFYPLLSGLIKVLLSLIFLFMYINILRRSSNAAPVQAGLVTINYILDERLREFAVEEKRMLTLIRLGKWVDRVRRFNPLYSAQMLDHFNLWPIPADEIIKKQICKNGTKS